MWKTKHWMVSEFCQLRIKVKIKSNGAEKKGTFCFYIRLSLSENNQHWEIRISLLIKQ